MGHYDKNGNWVLETADVTKYEETAAREGGVGVEQETAVSPQMRQGAEARQGAEGGPPGGTPVQEMQRRMAEIAQRRQQAEAEMQARVETAQQQMRQQVEATSKQIEETIHQRAGQYQAQRPFGTLEQQVMGGIEQAGARQQPQPATLTPEQQRLAQAAEAQMRQVAAQAAPGAAPVIGELPPPEAPRELPPPTRYPGPQEITGWRKWAEELPPTAQRDRTLAAINSLDEPAVQARFEDVVTRLSEAQDNPALKSLMDKSAQLAALEGQIEEAAARGDVSEALYNQYTAFLDSFTPEERELANLLGDLIPQVDDLQKQINKFIAGGTGTFTAPHGNIQQTLNQVPEAYRFVGVTNAALGSLDGKTYAEIYGSNETIQVPATERSFTTDDLARALDPDYAKFAAAMDLLHPIGAPLPSDDQLWREAASRTMQQAGAKMETVPGLKQIWDVLEPVWDHVIKPTGVSILGFLNYVANIPEDLLGVVISGWKYIFSQSPENYETWRTRMMQLSHDVYAPLLVQWQEAPGGGVDWRAGTSLPHIPKGKFELPPELQSMGFAYSDNPWLEMALQTVTGMAFGSALGSLTQAGALRQSGLISKLSNLAPGFREALRSGDMARARQLFHSSGLQGRIVREAMEATRAGEILDYVKPVSRIMGRTTDVRQQAKMLSRSVGAATDPQAWKAIEGSMNTINAMTNEAERVMAWGRVFTREIAQRATIPTKPGILTRFQIGRASCRERV